MNEAVVAVSNTVNTLCCTAFSCSQLNTHFGSEQSMFQDSWIWQLVLYQEIKWFPHRKSKQLSASLIEGLPKLLYQLRKSRCCQLGQSSSSKALATFIKKSYEWAKKSFLSFCKLEERSFLCSPGRLDPHVHKSELPAICQVQIEKVLPNPFQMPMAMLEWVFKKTRSGRRKMVTEHTEN